MRIGVPRESHAGERRVAATPKTVDAIRKLGYDVAIESGAGDDAAFDDEAYRAAGADIVGEDVWSCDVILKINAPSDAEIDRLRPGRTVVGLLAPALNPELVQRLSAQGVTALAMDAVPRISVRPAATMSAARLSSIAPKRAAWASSSSIMSGPATPSLYPG